MEDPSHHEKSRIAEYFLVAGLPNNPKPYDFSQVYLDVEEFVVDTTNDSIVDFTKYLEPIVDIGIINYHQRETLPDGYTIIDRTHSGQFKADLNGFTTFDEMYICYRRGRDKPPITDIGIYFEKSKLSLRPNAYKVTKTVGGRSANINNSSSNPMYLIFNRASPDASVDLLAVTNICIILSNKNESCPPAYNRVEQCLNSHFAGHRVFLCYKKSLVKQYVLSYEPSILYRYPPQGSMGRKDAPGDTERVASFCLPWGATIEAWGSQNKHPTPTFFTFVLTNEEYCRMYGAALSFYEEFDEKLLSAEQLVSLGFTSPENNSPTLSAGKKQQKAFSSKAICVLSRWPFFEAFKRFLSFLHKIVFSPTDGLKDPMLLRIPLERFISHFLHEVPFPTAQMPNVLVQISDVPICFQLPEESFNMTGGEPFYRLLLTLKIDHIIYLLLYMLTQQSILLTSLLHSCLTEIGEALRSMIFPLQWTAPYAPFIYLGMIPIIQSFTPFLFGVDSRFFDFFHLPEHLACLDIDTGTVRSPSRMGQLHLDPKILPKKPLKILKSSLEALYVDLTNCQTAYRECKMHNFTEWDEFKFARRRATLGMRVKECFLRFMANILKDYKKFIIPISNRAHADDFFDSDDFLKSTDRSCKPFYQILFNTQMWAGFIHERSYSTKRPEALAFFDHCIQRVSVELETVPLLQSDKAVLSEHTKVIGPPEVGNIEPEIKQLDYHRNRGIFPTDMNIVATCPVKDSSTSNNATTPTLSGRGDSSELWKFGGNAISFYSSVHKDMKLLRTILRRTKWETEEARRIGMVAKYAKNPRAWPIHLMTSCYNLWFLTLPAYLEHIITMNSKNLNPVANESFSKEQDCWLRQVMRASVRIQYQLKKTLKLANQLGRKAHLVSGEEAGNLSPPPNPTLSGDVSFPRTGETNFNSSLFSNNDIWINLPDDVPSKILVLLLGHFKLYGNYNSLDGEFSMSSRTSSNQALNNLFHWRLEDVETMSHNLIEQILFNFAFISREESVSQDAASFDSRDALITSKETEEIKLTNSDSIDGNVASDIGECNGNPPSADPDSKRVIPRRRLQSSNESQKLRLYMKSNMKKYYSITPADVIKFIQSRRLSVDQEDHSPTGSKMEYIPSVGLLLSTGDALHICHIEVQEKQPSTKAPIYSEEKKETIEPSIPSAHVPPPPVMKAVASIMPVTSAQPSFLSRRSVITSTTACRPQTKGMPGELSELPATYSLKKSRGSLDEGKSVISANNTAPMSPSLLLKLSGSLSSAGELFGSMLSDNIGLKGSAQALSNEPVSQPLLEPPSNVKSEITATGSSSSLSSLGLSFGDAFKRAGSIRPADMMKSMRILGDKMKPANWLSSSSGGEAYMPWNSKSNSSTNDPKRGQSILASTSQASEPGQNSSWSLNHAFASLFDSNDEMLEEDDDSDCECEVEDDIDFHGQYKNRRLSKEEVEERLINVWDLTSRELGHLLQHYVKPESDVDGQSSNTESNIPPDADDVMVHVMLFTCSSCTRCSNWIHDEDIMNGWTADISDLNTRCVVCQHSCVPKLTVRIVFQTPNNDIHNSPVAGEGSSVLRNDKWCYTLIQESQCVYLSPFVLRKEMETVIFQEGESILGHHSFLLQHDILFWNFVWFSTRIGLPTHMLDFLLPWLQSLPSSKTLKPESHVTKIIQRYSHKLVPGECHVHVHTRWDSPALRTKSAKPLYEILRQWQDIEMKRADTTNTAQTTPGTLSPRSAPLAVRVSSKIVYHIRENNMADAVKDLLHFRRSDHALTVQQGQPDMLPLHRNIYYLVRTQLGTDKINGLVFHNYYRDVFQKLPKSYSLPAVDRPLRPSALWCHLIFRDLDL